MYGSANSIGRQVSKTVWLGNIAESVLKEAGIGKGQVVLDFGCGLGNYSIPAAGIAGKSGLIYALDENEGALNELVRRAGLAELKNIKLIKLSVDSKIPLQSNSIDVVLLFDVLHSYYFPHRVQSRANSTFRIFQDSFIACYIWYRGDIMSQ